MKLPVKPTIKYDITMAMFDLLQSERVQTSGGEEVEEFEVESPTCTALWPLDLGAPDNSG
jgi:hypothetical protein